MLSLQLCLKGEVHLFSLLFKCVRSTQTTLQWLLQTTKILHVPLKRPSCGAQSVRIESCPLPLLLGWVSRSQYAFMPFFMVEKLVVWTVSSLYISPNLPLLLSPPLLLKTPKPSVQMNYLSMSNSGDRFCLLVNRSRADLPCIEIRRSETLIWNNLPHLDQSARPDAFSQREWINKNVPYANYPLLFTFLIFSILSLFWLSARQQACSCLLHPWINLSSVCALFCE